MGNYTDILNRYKKSILKKKNVIGVGFGYKERKGRTTEEEALIVLVKKKVPVSKISKKEIIPQRVQEYKTDVIEIGEVVFHQDRTKKLRPARPGVSIGHYKVSAGTFGAVVRDKKTGTPLILSNNHVLANISNGIDNRARKGDPILQPGTYDDGRTPGDIIGYLERFVPIHSSEGRPDCGVAISIEKAVNFFLHLFRNNYNFRLFKDGETNLVDCAVAKTAGDGLIASKMIEIGDVLGVTEPEINMEVKKSGRSSGLTKGRIVAIEATLTVNMNETDTAVFEDQFITTPLSKPGDSGSLILDMNNNAVGLLFAGSEKATVCNRISNVLEKLSVKF
ncbi:MAG: hypothetical protein GX175_10095 [Halanaerobiaceae bacterium]|nr:hypothetical protein [Halanaerobiaceae bacterium]